MTPGLSTQPGQDRLSLLHSCRLSDTQCHLQTHLFSSSLWQPPPHHHHHIHVVLGNQTLGANRMDAHWNAFGSWASLLPSFLPLAVHWQHTWWLQSRCEDTHCTCHSSPGPLPCGTHTLGEPHPPCPTTLTDVVKASRSPPLWQVSGVQERGQEGHGYVLLVIQHGFIS